MVGGGAVYSFSSFTQLKLFLLAVLVTATFGLLLEHFRYLQSSLLRRESAGHCIIIIITLHSARSLPEA